MSQSAEHTHPEGTPDQERYYAALHAIQTGVAMEHQRGSKDGEPKHLRVGIASGQISQAALYRCLLRRGLIEVDEFEAELADEAERMVAEYEHRLSAAYGTKVHLS